METSTMPEQTRPTQLHTNVEVIVDGTPTKVEAGTYIVSDFKQLVGVEASKELEEIVQGKLVPLADESSIAIKSGQRFVSHIRRGGSS
jgi:hypothetical protein